MSAGTLIYKVPGRTTRVTYKGQLDFDPCSLPLITKSEYGLDSMSINYIGPAPKLAAFLATLTQGKRYDQNGRQWYLQTWSPDDNPIWPTVTLNCVGLAEGRLPRSRRQNAIITQSVTVNAVVVESQETSPGSEVFEDVDVTVTREVVFRALQTSWSYITNGDPRALKHGTVSRQADPQIVSSTITAVGGTTNVRYNGSNAPARYVSATQAAIVDFLMDMTPSEVPGTPYFEVSETVARIFIAT